MRERARKGARERTCAIEKDTLFYARELEQETGGAGFARLKTQRTDRHRDRETARRYAYRQTDRHTGRQAGRQIDRQAHRQTDRQAHRLTDTQTDRQAGR